MRGGCIRRLVYVYHGQNRIAFLTVPQLYLIHPLPISLVGGAVDSGTSGPGSSPGWELRCVLGKYTLPL